MNVYGPTETTVECAAHRTNRCKEDEIASIGKSVQSMRNVHAYVFNKDTGARTVDQWSWCLNANAGICVSLRLFTVWHELDATQ